MPVQAVKNHPMRNHRISVWVLATVHAQVALATCARKTALPIASTANQGISILMVDAGALVRAVIAPKAAGTQTAAMNILLPLRRVKRSRTQAAAVNTQLQAQANDHELNKPPLVSCERKCFSEIEQMRQFMAAFFWRSAVLKRLRTFVTA